MSIAVELGRIQSDRNMIRAKLVELGMANNTDNLDKLAQAIEALVNRGAVQVSLKEGETYTIPAGYHNGSGTVLGVSGGGSYELQSKNVTPTKKQQGVTPDSGYYGLSGVTVAAIPDAYQDVTSVTLLKEEALTGRIFVASDGTVVTGEMPNNGDVNKTLDGTTVTYIIPKGYHSGAGTVKIVLETKSVTPTKSMQEVTPTSGKVLSKVTVEAIPDQYKDTSDADVTADKMLDGTIGYGKDGRLEGSIPVNGDTSETIDGLTKTSVTIPAGYTTGGTVSLTSDIEDSLAAI